MKCYRCQAKVPNRLALLQLRLCLSCAQDTLQSNARATRDQEDVYHPHFGHDRCCGDIPDDIDYGRPFAEERE